MERRLSKAASQKSGSRRLWGICKPIFGACILERQSESVSQSSRRGYSNLGHKENFVDFLEKIMPIWRRG